MNTTFRPISKRRLAELQGYVAWGTTLFRTVLFAAALGGFAWLLRAVHVRLGRPLADSDLVWILPTLAVAIVIYGIAGRWTGGRALRAAIRKDLAGGVAAVHHVVALDAVEVEEGEDEGPAYFILTEDGRTLLFAGQYLGPYQRKGFPWIARGEKLAPSARRSPFTWEEYKQFVRGIREYGVVDIDFAALKSKLAKS